MVVFISDTSTQQSNVISPLIKFTSMNTPSLVLTSTSGIYIPSLNNVRIFTNKTDAFIIDSNNILYGNGSGFTNFTASQIPSLDASKITSGTLNTSLLPSYSTTSQMLSAIALSNLTFTLPLSKTANNVSVDLSLYDTISLRGSAITTALVPYSTTTLMNSAITTALTPYSTTTLMNSAITTALTPYSTTTLMNSAITTALTPFDTITARNTSLSSYLTLSGGTVTGNLIINSTNGGLILQNVSGGAFGYASAIGNYSTSASAGDVVLRGAGNNLILQSGSSTAALTINSANNISITNTLNATTIQQGGVGVSSLISSAITTSLTSYSSTTGMNSAISTALIPFSTTTTMNSAITSALTPYDTISARNNSLSSYLPLSGGTMTGILYGSSITLTGNIIAPTFFQGGTNISTLYVNTSGGSTISGNLSITGILYSTNNVGIGITNPSYKLVVYGDYTYLYGLRLSGNDPINTIWNGSANMGVTVNSGYTINLGMNGGNGNILSLTNTSATITQPTTLNSTLSVSGATYLNSTTTSTLTANQIYCSSSSIAYNANWNSTGYNGCFIGINGWWYLGFCNLNVSIFCTINGGYNYYWMGRIQCASYLAGGGIIGFSPDLASTGPASLILSNVWDGGGNNCIRVSNSLLATYGGTCSWRIMG